MVIIIYYIYQFRFLIIPHLTNDNLLTRIIIPIGKVGILLSTIYADGNTFPYLYIIITGLQYVF